MIENQTGPLSVQMGNSVWVARLTILCLLKFNKEQQQQQTIITSLSIMSQYTATVIKNSKDQSIGIGLAQDPNKGLIIKFVKSEGPLGQSCLKQGMRLLTINNIKVSGLSSKEAVAMLKEAEGKLVLTAEEFVPANITFQVNRVVSRGDNGQRDEKILGMMKHDVNNAMPTIFKEAGVPSDTFCRIYKLIDSNLLPPAIALDSHEFTYSKEMNAYTGKQMVKSGLIGFGTESNHEKKVFHMVTQGAQLQRNVDLKAAQVKDKINAMLAKYNIMATIALESKPLVKYSSKQPKANVGLYIVGIELFQIELTISVE